jgi:hypothetical protein
MPGNKPGRPCNVCLEKKDHPNHFTDSTKKVPATDFATGRCKECNRPLTLNAGKIPGHPAVSDNGSASQTYLKFCKGSGKEPKAKATDAARRARLHRALDAVMDSRSGISKNTVKMAAESAEKTKRDALASGATKEAAQVAYERVYKSTLTALLRGPANDDIYTEGYCTRCGRKREECERLRLKYGKRCSEIPQSAK